MGIWLICVCSDNIHKLENPRDGNVISFPQSEGVSKFLPLWGCFSGNELCLHQKLNVRLTCHDIFKGKGITFLFQWTKLIKMPPLYSGAFKRKLFFGSEWKQRQRWKESFLKRNKKANTKACINAESVCWGGGAGGALYLDWELRSEAPWTNSLPLVILKFWEKSHFWMFHEQSWQPQCFHSVGVLEEPRWADSACTPDWVRCVYLKATNTLGINWKPAHILLVYDVNQLVGLIFTINGLFYNRLNGGLVQVPYKTTEI